MYIYIVFSCLSISAIKSSKIQLNLFLASGDFCRLSIALANSLNPDRDQQIWTQTVSHPDSVPLWFLLWKFYFPTKSADDNKSMQKTSMQVVKIRRSLYE